MFAGGVWVFTGCVETSKCEQCSSECNPITYYTVFWLVVGCSALMAIAWACIAVVIAVSIVREQTVERLNLAEKL